MKSIKYYYGVLMINDLFQIMVYICLLVIIKTQKNRFSQMIIKRRDSHNNHERFAQIKSNAQRWKQVLSNKKRFWQMRIGSDRQKINAHK